MVKPQTILLVDDHSLITTAMSALLQSSRVSLISSEHPLTPLPIPVW